MSELELEPHEELSEIDRRTNKDGTVEVELLSWEKSPHSNRVDVNYRIPTGEVRTESMEWPQANDTTHKFIRLIDSTPYTLLTAEEINNDNDLIVNADPISWSLILPEEKSLRQKIPKPKRGVAFEAAKLVLYPAAVLTMVTNIFEKDMEYVGFRGSEYESTYLEDEIHHEKHVTAIKATLYTILWILIFTTFVL